MAKEFKIGLAMSGAISAGAYSAGVYDFLIEALEEWEKKRTKEGVPQHRVILAAMAGASAGAITSSVGTLAASQGANPTLNGKEAYRVLPNLYTAWVADPDFLVAVKDSAGNDATNNGKRVGCLLSTEDLEDAHSVFSLLNAQPLRYIGDKAISAVGADSSRTAQPYFPENLHLYLTLSNLRGLPYAIDFAAVGGGSKYGMMCHRDWAHYCLKGIGTATFQGLWAATDNAKVVLDATTIPNPIAGDWSAYIDNTLGSGAFPVGLSACQLKNNREIYAGRHWPLPFKLNEMDNVKPNWPTHLASSSYNVTVQTPHLSPPPQGGRESYQAKGCLAPPPLRGRELGGGGERLPYNFATVDGGAIDNDPFQFVRYALMQNPPHPLERNPAMADRTVIMISPFPEPPKFEIHYDAKKSGALLAVIKRLVPMFIQQNRFKPEEIFNALKPDTASRWMISPRRSVVRQGKYEPQEYGIACGLLGGFGGFLDREFREHDYELGRKNCQDFLARWFGLPENPNIDGFNLLPQPPGRRNGEADFANFPIIPLCGSAAKPVQVRDWPRVPKQKVNDFTTQAMARLNRVRELLTANLDFTTGTWLWAGWMGGKSKLEALVRYTVLGDLIRRDQLDDTNIKVLQSQPDHIKVLLACVDPAYDYRSAAGIARQLGGHLTKTSVAGILGSLKNAGLLETFWRGVKNGKLVGRAETGLGKVGGLFGFGSNTQPIYTYIDRQKSMVGIPCDPSFD